MAIITFELNGFKVEADSRTARYQVLIKLGNDPQLKIRRLAQMALDGFYIGDNGNKIFISEKMKREAKLLLQIVKSEMEQKEGE